MKIFWLECQKNFSSHFALASLIWDDTHHFHDYKKSRECPVFRSKSKKKLARASRSHCLLRYTACSYGAKYIKFSDRNIKLFQLALRARINRLPILFMWLQKILRMSSFQVGISKILSSASRSHHFFSQIPILFTIIKSAYNVQFSSQKV